MSRKNLSNIQKEKVVAVLKLLRKQAPLTVQQEKFCDTSCVERFLKANGNSVKRATKHLRSCISWRERIGAENLVADEFSSEIAEGVAYVAGHDEESRPIFRIKQDYLKFHSQKLRLSRLVAFTLQVAIGTLPKGVEEFVILFNSSLFKSSPALKNVLVVVMKIVGEYYPGRLHRAFVIDPPTLFSYLWKGVRKFLEFSAVTTVVYSRKYDDDLSQFKDRRASSLRFDPSPSSSSSRFTFTPTHPLNSLKPWYLSFATPSPPSLNKRSFSLASPATRKTLFPSETPPLSEKHRTPPLMDAPRPSFLQSSALFFRNGGRSRESFVPYLKLYRECYDEMMYRSKMRPPLGGIVSIVHPLLLRRDRPSSQRF